MNNTKTFNRTKEDNKIKLGAKLVVEFSGLSHEGLGISKFNGESEKGDLYENYPLFVMGALPFEKGIVEIDKFQKNMAYGHIVKLFPDTFNRDRVKPICEQYPECGGCNIMHMSYDAQLRFKRQSVVNILSKNAKINDVRVEPVLGMEYPLYYRNKVQIPFGSERNKTIAGFYKRDTHQIIPLEKCYIQAEISTEIAKFIKNLCNEFQIRGYNEKYHEGDIRHVLIKTNSDVSQMMVVLVTLSEKIPNINNFIQKLVARYPIVTTIVQNINTTKNSTMLSDKNNILYGNGYLIDNLCGKKFQIGATSFYQVNSQQTEQLYCKALEIANFQKNDTIIDAYCGIGTIGIIASDHVKHVYGVEIIPEAILNAQTNMKINNITNATYVCNKAEDQIIEWANQKINIDAIIVDPPRKGCEKLLLETIVRMKISKILYISCNPATLARDLRFLVEQRYQLKLIQPIDMFPNSSHIETIVLLEKRKR